VSELYFHPATGPWHGVDPAIADYDFSGELQALVSARVRTAVQKPAIRLTSYSELASLG
jgi:hypothetical protein